MLCLNDRVKRIKEKVDDPMLAWFCLFVSAVVLVTRLYLNQPDSVLTIGIPASQGGQGQGQGGEGAKLPGGCEPLDEVCAARMLAESEGVSHFEDVTTHNFYNLMSQYATYLITFLTLYLFSFAGLRRYQRRRDGYKLRRSLGEEQVTELQQLLMDEPASENEDFIPFVLCAFSVSVSVAALLLVPITILYGFWVKCTHGEVCFIDPQPPPSISNILIHVKANIHLHTFCLATRKETRGGGELNKTPMHLEKKLEKKEGGGGTKR
jgi:hypothetical protein